MRLTLSLLALAAGCAHATDRTDWRQVESRGFRMFTPAGVQQQVTILGSLEAGWAALRSSFFKDSVVGKPDVLVLDADTYAATVPSTRTVVSVAPRPGQGDDLGRRGLLVVLANGPLEARLEMLTFLLVHQAMPKAPFWFQHGLASYARGLEYTQDGTGRAVACFGRTRGPVAPRGPLEVTLGASRSSFAPDLRGTSAVLVDYAIHGEAGQNVLRLEALLGRLRAGDDTPALLRVAFPTMTVPALAARLHDHGARMSARSIESAGPCPLGFFVPPERAPDLGPWRGVPADRAQIRKALERVRLLDQASGYPGWYP